MITPRAPRLLRAAFCLVVPAFLGASLGASGCSKPVAQQEVAVVVEDLSPVPAPQGHLADLIVPSPDAVWTKARTLVGGPAIFFPQSFGALAATMLKLPVVVGPEIDGGVPVLGAALKNGETPTQAAIGIHIKAGGRFIDQLTKVPDARFSARLDEATRITVLTSKSDTPGAAPPAAMGVLGNYLLVARQEADLLAAGPYIARTLPSRPVPKEDAVIEMPEAALSGPVLAEAQRAWTGTRSDLERVGAPALVPVVGTVEMFLGVLADSKLARLTLDLDAASVHARFTMTPKPDGGAASKALAEMAVGDADPLLDLPGSALLGILWREPAAVRSAAIPKQAESLAGLLGPETKAEDKEAILAALRAEDEARGDWATLGVSLDPTGPNAMVRAPLSSAEKMSNALKQLVALSKLPSVKAQLKAASLEVTSGKTVIENMPGEAQRVRFEKIQPKGAKGKAASLPEAGIPGSIDLLYMVAGDLLLGAAGYDPKAALLALRQGPAETSLRWNPAMKSALTSLGADASFALVVDPLRILAQRSGKSAPNESAPVVVALGKTPEPSAMWARVDVAALVVQELIKHRGAF